MAKIATAGPGFRSLLHDVWWMQEAGFQELSLKSEETSLPKTSR